MNWTSYNSGAPRTFFMSNRSYLRIGIHGGLCQISMQYAKANNHITPDYDATKPKLWLIYQDCNNLYGWLMAQSSIAYGEYKCVKPTLDVLNNLDESLLIGHVYDVDIHTHNIYTTCIVIYHSFPKTIFHQVPKFKS